MEKSLLFVVGARPNFIKIAPICVALRKASNLSFKILHTGQHYDQLMSDIFFQELEIPAPDFHLNIGSAPHGVQTGQMMIEMEKLCDDHAFIGIVVIGDVNSTLAGAMVGAKRNIPVIHIESGLRSYNRSMPEEINRIATDHVSDLLFAPTQLAMQNLQKEGLAERSFFSGDVMYDMILQGLELASTRSDILNQLSLYPDDYFLATLHRPYNVDDPHQLRQIMTGLSNIGKQVLLSAHPRLHKQMKKFEIQAGENVKITQPFGYFDFIVLEKNALKIITDSGGIQKEAFFLQTPCVTLRPETEWVETVETRANILVKDRTAASILEAAFENTSPAFDQRPYGNGNASEIIVEKLIQDYL